MMFVYFHSLSYRKTYLFANFYFDFPTLLFGDSKVVGNHFETFNLKHFNSNTFDQELTFCSCLNDPFNSFLNISSSLSTV